MAQLDIVHRSVPWFPARIEYRSAGTLDAYGRAVDYDWAILPCKIRSGNVEMIDKGVRTFRNGITIETTPQSFYELDDMLVWNGTIYTIIGIDMRTDYTGQVQFVTLTAVDKR